MNSHNQEKEVFLILRNQSSLLPCNFRKRNVGFTLWGICMGQISTLAALIRKGEEGIKELLWSLKPYGALEDIKQRKSPLCSYSSLVLQKAVQRNVSASTEGNLGQQGTLAI